MKRLIWLIASIMLFSTLAFSQAAPKDELGCSTKEGKAFDSLIGNWNVKSTFRVGSNPDKWEETEGTSKIAYTFDGCLANETLSIKRGGRPLTVVSMYSFNNLTNQYQWMYAHSEHGVLSLFEGTQTAAGFVFKDSFEFRGRKFHFERLLKKTKSGFTLTANRSFDEGKSWRTDWILNYSR